MADHHVDTRNSELYRGDPDLVAFPLDGDNVAALTPVQRKLGVMTAFQADLVRRCRRFAPLDVHAERLFRVLNLTSGSKQDLREQLEELARSGFLFSVQSANELLEADAVAGLPEQNSIESLGIPTRNRPESLRRCLLSYAQCAAEFGRKIKFIVADQSEPPEVRAANMGSIEAVKAQFGGEMSYAGMEEQKRFVSVLAKAAGLDECSVAFALLNPECFPIATGANRNVLLLATVGELALQVDDDSICTVARFTESADKLTFTSKGDPTEFRFPDRCFPQEIYRNFSMEDFFALHEQFLGREMSVYLGENQKREFDFNSAKPQLLETLHRGNNTVCVSALGVGGASGIGSAIGFLRLDAESRAHLMRSESVYRSAFENDLLLRAVIAPSIGDSQWCSGLNLGLDNRRFLPPFLPVQRSQDGVFSALLHAISRPLFAHLPWFLLHADSGERQQTRDDLRKQFASLKSADLLVLLIRKFAPQPLRSQPADNLAALGRTLCEWGSAAQGDFEEMLFLVVAQMVASRLEEFEKRLARYKRQPAFWAKDMEMCIEASLAALPGNGYITPWDLSDCWGESKARATMQLLVRKTGEMLMIWSDLREAALFPETSGH